MFINWLKFYKETCDYNVESLEIVCMDDKCHNHLKHNGVSCSSHSFVLEFNESNEKLGLVWTKRLQIVNSYLREGVDLILCDSDAIWVSDPLPDISKYSLKADLVASRGWWPWPVYHQWGSCLCMGFIFLKANAFNIDLFNRVFFAVNIQSQKYLYYHAHNMTIDKNFIKPDDQLAINYQLFMWNITWLLPEDNFKLKNHNHSLVHKMNIETNEEADTGVVIRNNTQYFVTLLPQMNYVRNCHNQSWSWKRRTRRMRNTVEKYTSQAIVAHCRLPTGDSKSKKRYMSTFHLWKLGFGEYERSGKPGYDPRMFVVNKTAEAEYNRLSRSSYNFTSALVRRNRTKTSKTKKQHAEIVFSSKVDAILNSSRFRKYRRNSTRSRMQRSNKVSPRTSRRKRAAVMKELEEKNEGIMF